MRNPDCRAENPDTCRKHGGLQYGFQPLALTRQVGMSEQSLSQYLQESAIVAAQLTDREEDTLRRYSVNNYSYINAYLRAGRQGLKESMIRMDFARPDRLNEQRMDKEESDAMQEIRLLDSAIAKSPRAKDTRVLYRVVRVRGADSKAPVPAAQMKAHLERTYRVGGTFEDKGFGSASLDSDMPLFTARRRPTQVMVQEIITDLGLPLAADELHSGSIQSREREVLLPRGLKFEVTNVGSAWYERAGEPVKNDPFMTYGRYLPRRRFPVVQLRVLGS